MTDEIKKLVTDLREDAEWAQANEWETPITLGDNLTAAADLIESLSAELEQVKRERDAAVEDLHLWGCFSCKHAGYSHSEICASCVYNRNRIAKGYVSGKNRYEWRGVKEESDD